MHTLPAVVPEGEVPRSDVVAARLARRLAPLFGVPWAGNPYQRTWVCDFSALTLSEIARGAPLPSREEPGGTASGRGVPAGADDLPPIANATLNRFGPSTKAAVVLTGANRLLTEVTAAVTQVCQDTGRQDLNRGLQLAVWAGLVLEVFRAQPALVVAALQARAIQRSLTTRWGAHVAGTAALSPGARPEIGAAPGPPGDPGLAPVRFALLDSTLRALSPKDATGAPLGDQRLDDIASAWAHRLLRMGSPGSGIVWLQEDCAGHRTAHAYQRVGAMISPFVAEVLDADLDHVQRLPAWPDDATLAASGDLTVRAHGVALHAAANYVRYLQTPAQHAPDLRTAIASLTRQAAGALTRRLGEDDPATLLLTGYTARNGLEDALRRPGPADPARLTEAVGTQVDVLRRASKGWRAGRLAPGNASYLLEIGCVALGATLDRAGHLLDATVLDTATRALHRAWREALTARGVPDDPAGALPDLTPSQIFHLLRYAEHLARRDTAADLRRALTVMEAVAQVRDAVARDEPAALTAKHTSAREVHELACRIAWRLRELTPPRERTAASRHTATAGRHALAVLADPSTSAILAGPANAREAAWVLDCISPVLLHILAGEDVPLPAAERASARRLIEAAGPEASDTARKLADLLLP